VNDLLYTRYVPIEVNEAIRALAICCNQAASTEGLQFSVRPLPDGEHGCPPPSFNLVSATHHASGAISAVFESNQSVLDLEGTRLTHAQVYRSHMILFEQSLHTLKGRKGP
jgi:hypothetical protein